MKYISKTHKVIIPDEVQVDVKARKVVVKGPRGTVEKEFKHIKADIIKKEGEEKGKKIKYLEVTIYLSTYKQSAILYTLCTHIKSMIDGVISGYRYKMVCVKKHFPISVSVVGGNVEVKNFIGCKENFLIPIAKGVTVVKNEKNQEGELWFEGNDKEVVAANAARLNQSCDVGDKDKRKFLDGIYCSERGLIQN
jgi:large subunit ribosomal protein L9e